MSRLLVEFDIDGDYIAAWQTVKEVERLTGKPTLSRPYHVQLKRADYQPKKGARYLSLDIGGKRSKAVDPEQVSLLGEKASHQIEELDLPPRPYNLLKYAGIVTYGDLYKHSRATVGSIKGFGLASLRDLEAALQRKGLPPLRKQ
jgi:hypothetical protein